MNSVLLTHAYFLNEDPKEKRVMKPYPPLGILYLSAWLEKHDVEHEVFDSTFSDLQSQRKFLVDLQPAIIGIYTNLMTKVQVKGLIDFIRSQPALDRSLIVLGGPDTTHNVENYLAIGADVLVIGEGEQSMLEIVQACESGLWPQFEPIDGIAFKDGEGRIIRTRARDKMRNIDELPFPNWKKINLDLYLKTWKKHHGHSSMSVSTQRGCPYTCRWCSTAVYGQSYRRRSPGVVADELDSLQKAYAPDRFWFVDDVFTISHRWMEAFRDELIMRGMTISYECISRADRLSEEILSLLKETGCFRIWIGAESGSQKILDAMDRRVDALQVREMIITARRLGMEAGTFIMLGYPGETETDIFQTLEHLQTADPDLFTITVAYPIKGTVLYEMTESTMVKPSDWASATDRDIDFKRTYPRLYYDFAVRWITSSVLLHKMKKKGNSTGRAGWKARLKMIGARSGMALLKSLG